MDSPGRERDTAGTHLTLREATSISGSYDQCSLETPIPEGHAEFTAPAETQTGNMTKEG